MYDLPDIVYRYLKKYSFDTWHLESNLKYNVENAVVVPIICEYDNLRTLLSALLKNDPKYFLRTIVIFVVNNFSNSSEDVKHDNQKALHFLREIISCKASSDPLISELNEAEMNVGVIDASSPGLEMPKKIGGVGLARKIGMDSALKIFNHQSQNKKTLICLDADCLVETNYLASIIEEFNSKNLSASYLNFAHNINDDSATTEAIICYEIFLHYYVLGLKYAKSPYAFHTIGSTMICDYESYIKSEGMNKKKAAEDFYFMEKLAKNYKIEKINSTTVYPSSRSSWRVPFGTGQRVGRFLEHKQNEYLLYDPIGFDILKQWLLIFTSEGIKGSNDYLKFAPNIHPELANFLMEQNFISDWNKILENSTSAEQISKQKQKWFDGFKTLKLIHYLRDKSFPQINMFKALNGLLTRLEISDGFFTHEKDVPNLDIQKKYLELLRNLT